MIRTKHFLLVSIGLILLGLIIWLFTADTEAPVQTPQTDEIIFMAEPQEYTVEHRESNNYMSRAIFIEKIRKALLLNPIPPPEPEAEPEPTFYSTYISNSTPTPPPIEPVIINAPQPNLPPPLGTLPISTSTQVGTTTSQVGTTTSEQLLINN